MVDISNYLLWFINQQTTLRGHHLVALERSRVFLYPPARWKKFIAMFHDTGGCHTMTFLRRHPTWMSQRWNVATPAEVCLRNLVVIKRLRLHDFLAINHNYGWVKRHPGPSTHFRSVGTWEAKSPYFSCTLGFEFQIVCRCGYNYKLT